MRMLLRLLFAASGVAAPAGVRARPAILVASATLRQ
jgi:hypothetical protein